MPSLRYIDFHDISLLMDYSPSPIASQVTHIAVATSLHRSNLSLPLATLSFFPSATIVKIDLCIFHYSDLRSLFVNLTPALRTLFLTLRPLTDYSDWKPVDDLLPVFPLLQELHFSRTFHRHLLFLPHLVDLSLILGNLIPDFVQLLKGPHRLRYLSTLNLERRSWQRHYASRQLSFDLGNDWFEYALQRLLQSRIRSSGGVGKDHERRGCGRFDESRIRSSSFSSLTRRIS